MHNVWWSAPSWNMAQPISVTNPDWTDIVSKIPERQPNLWADILDATYFYVWFTQVWTTNWRIQRIAKSDFSIAWASGTTAPATAWSWRWTLTYNISL